MSRSMSPAARRLVGVVGLLAGLVAALPAAEAGDAQGRRSGGERGSVAAGGFDGAYDGAVAGRRFEQGNIGSVVVGGGSFIATRRYIDDHRDEVNLGASRYVDRHKRSYDGRTAYESERRWGDGEDRAYDRVRRDGDRGSFVRLHDRSGIERAGHRSVGTFGPDGSYRASSTVTTFDTDDWRGGPSVVYYGLPALANEWSASAEPVSAFRPRIVDVEAERLDKRPIGPSGIDVVDTGGARIIRIAPGYRLAGQTLPKPRGGARGLERQPWSAAWLTYCSRTHRSFDPDLGTYVTANGKVRFCTAE